MSLADLLAGAERAPGRVAADVPPTWMQGRTAYGGLSVALAHEAALSAATDLPPLRSAQVSFVGPLAGRVTASAAVLRRGRSTAFVQVDVAGDDGVGLRAMLVFTAARPSTLSFEGAAAPPAPDPDEAASAMRRSQPNFFSANFEARHALPASDRPEPIFRRWIRLAEREGLDPTTALLVCADALPPAAMALMATPAPVSSVTWLINMLAPQPQSRDGWWLMQARAEQVGDGVSSQTMAMWDRERRPVAAGMQSVAVFV